MKGGSGVFAFNSKGEQNNLFSSSGLRLPFIRGHFARGETGERRNGVLSKAFALLFCVRDGASSPLKEGGNRATTCSNILNNKGVRLIKSCLSSAFFPFEPGVAETDG